MVAKTGTYTIRYRLTYDDADKDGENATVKDPDLQREGHELARAAEGQRHDPHRRLAHG